MNANAALPLTRRQALVDVLLVILLVPASAVFAAVFVAFFTPTPNLSVVLTVQALLALGGVGVLLGWRGEPWSGIGLRRPQMRDVGRGLLVMLAGFAVNALLTAAVMTLSPQTLEAHLAGLQSVAAGLTDETPLLAALVLLLLVGLYEEVVARGLLLTRSRRLLGGAWAPAVLSAVLFALGHYYQGAYGVLQTALYGLVLAAFTIRWGTLWPAIIAHSAVNMLSVVQLGNLTLPG